MKKTIFYLVAAMAVLACSKTEEKEVVVEPQKSVYTLYGNIAQETGTKVYINDNNNNPHTFSHYWKEGDVISVFSGSGGEGGSPYTVTKESAGSSAGTFTGSFGVGDTFYAIYPYNNGENQEDYSGNAVGILEEGPTFTVKYPASQVLTDGSYDPAANVYVATGADTELTFYNTTAYLRLALYTTLDAEVSVSKIELSTLDETNIAGTGIVTLTGGTPNGVKSVIIEDDNAQSSILLEPASPNTSIAINKYSELPEFEPTYFYVAVPAISYDDNFAGYQVKIYSGTEDAETYQFRNFSTALTANKVRLLPALEYNPVSSGSTATLVIGEVLNKALKSLAAGSNINDHTAEDNSIIKIIIETNKNMTGYTGTWEKQTIVSETGSELIVASYKEGTIRIQTAASKIHTQSCASMFRAMKELKTITGLENFVIGSGESMGHMFFSDSALESLDLSGVTFEDPSKTNSIIQMVAYCTSLSSFTSPASIQTASCQNVFQNCTSLTTLDLSSFNTSSTTSMNKMFSGCSSLESVNLSSFNTTNVTNMSEMFSGCSTLETLDLSNFNTGKVTNASSMFYNCSGLTSINFGTGSGKFAKCENCSKMFSGCSNITEIDVTSFTISESPAKNGTQDLSEMFEGCTKLTTLTVPEGRWARWVMNTSGMFKNCSSLETLDIHGVLKGAIQSDINKATGMFENCSKLTTLTISPSNYDYTLDFSNMFMGCAKLETINRKQSSGAATSTKIGTGMATTLAHMFDGCSKLRKAQLTSNFSFSTSNVTDMSYMFNECNYLTSLDLSSFDTRKVTDFSYMFKSCGNLTSIDLSGENCSTASASSDSFNAFILNDYKLATLKLSSSFNFGEEQIESISYQFWPNPGANSMGTLSIYCTKVACQNMLQKGGAQSGNAPRIVTGINSGKFVFKSIEDETKSWTFWNDETQCTPGDSTNPVTNTCTVGDAE